MTTKDFMAALLYRIKKLSCRTDLVLDEGKLGVYEQLALYFLANPNFKGDLNKGICLYGGVGVGKTMTFKALRETVKGMNDHLNKTSLENIDKPGTSRRCVTFKEGFPLATCPITLAPVSSEGVVEACRAPSEGYISMQNPDFLKRRNHLTIEDLGLEETRIMVFGTEVWPVRQLLHSRYESMMEAREKKKRELFLTFATTNRLDFDKIYNDRTHSRMFELFNFIEMPGEDLR